jgi:hypothetical protein
MNKPIVRFDPYDCIGAFVTDKASSLIRCCTNAISNPTVAKLLLFVCTLLCCLPCVEVSAAETRPASKAEIQALFDLATVGPQRLRVVADIYMRELPISQEQISQELKAQIKDLGHGMNSTWERDSSNAIARSHSGLRILHVQEWYSGNHYRLDQTDEGLYSPEYLKANPGKYRNGFVNLDDPALSIYQSFFVDYELRAVQLNKARLYGRNNLWRVLGLDEEVALPVLIALLDPTSGPKGRPATDFDLSTFKLDASKAKRLHDGTDRDWHIEAVDEIGAGKVTRLTLRGKFISPDDPTQPSDVEVACQIGFMSQRIVCLEAVLTNRTAHNSFLSTRGDFDGRDIPRKWKKSTLKLGADPKQVEVVFKQIDLDAVFDEKQVFSTVFPTNYIVLDVTSGTPDVLQSPFPKAKATRGLAPLKRAIVLCVLGTVTLLSVFVLRRLKT